MGRDRVMRPEAQRLRSHRAPGALLVGLLVVSGLSPVVSSADDGIRRDGSLDRRGGLSSIAANGNLIVDHAARRAYQAVQDADTMLYEYDLDTLRETRSLVLPKILAAQTSAGPTEWMWALDAEHRRLFTFHKGLPDQQTRLEDHPLLTVDLDTMTLTDQVPMWPASDRTPIGMSYHAPSDRLYLLTRVKIDLLGRGVFILEERTPDGTLVWERQLNACFAARDHQYPPTVARSVLQPAHIYLNCYGPREIESRVLRVVLGDDGRPAREEFFAAVPGPLSTAFDPGSDRMFFLTINGGAGRGAWVFDGLRSSFVGVIASGDPRLGASDYSMGVDPTTGRIYLQTPAGFLVADARRTPLPAGLIFRDLAGFGTGSIQVDPVRRTVFVPDPASMNEVGQPQRYLVLRDGISVSQDPVRGDPDALTVDVAERDGVTDVNVSGGARAYAARVLQTGGVQKAAWNIALGLFAPQDLFGGAVWNTLLTAPVDQRNRDVSLARVRGVSLTNDAADAVAIAADADLGTQRDLEDNGPGWPFTSTECHDAGEPASATGAGTGASCDAASQTVIASAAAATLDGVVRARDLSAWASVVRDPERGLVARSVAEATSIRIAERVWIGSLRAEAETWARGRPGTAGARFERTLTDVRIDADGDGDIDARCDVCDASSIAPQINEALAGQAAVEFPEPDRAWFPDGSPGGFQAVVEKGRFRAFAERALNDDDAAEVVGMQVSVFQDGRAGRTRYIAQLAGVQAESHYGIFLLPTTEEQPPTPRTTRPPAAAPRPPSAPGPVIDDPAGVPARYTYETLTERVAVGVGVFVSSPREATMLALLWGFLLLPAYLLWRRRVAGSAA